jgi:hypothetical protein
MAATLKITDGSTGSTTVVDMTNLDPKFTYTATNPFIIIKVPNPVDASDTPINNFNAVCINLAMFAPRISITFTESGGLGDTPFHLYTRTTNFSKLVYFSQIDKDKKRLYVNSDYVWCQIDSYRAQNDAGKKDIVVHYLDVTILGGVSQ